MADESLLEGQPSNTQQATTETNVAPSANNQMWYSSLPDELKSDPNIIKFKDPASLAKSYIHLQRNLGADKIALPGENATDDDWKQVYRKLGVPESLDEYKVNSPEGLDGEVIKQTSRSGS